MNIKEVRENYKEWFTKGYNDQCWGYPLLDHVWDSLKYPKQCESYYKSGQIQYYLDNKVKKPWFYKDITTIDDFFASFDWASLSKSSTRTDVLGDYDVYSLVLKTEPLITLTMDHFSLDDFGNIDITIDDELVFIKGYLLNDLNQAKIDVDKILIEYD